MATPHPTSRGGVLGTVTERFLDAVDEAGLSWRWYLLVVAGTSIASCTAVIAVTLSLEAPPVTRFVVYGVGLLAVVTVLAYPAYAIRSRRKGMDSRLHLFVTHMTVLSMTNIDRMDVFRSLAFVEEYGALADEMGRIVQLVDAWHQSLDDACRRRARQVPSKALANILERLAYTLGVGQGLSDFLSAEQHVIMENYVTVYESALGRFGGMKDLYFSFLLTSILGLVAAVSLPVMTSIQPTAIVGILFALFVVVQLGFVLAVELVTPHDPRWYRSSSVVPRSARTIRTSLLVGWGLAGSLVLVVLGHVSGVIEVWPIDVLPMVVLAVLPLTPLLIPGLVLRREEGIIRHLEDEFPSFVRALGTAESAKQTTTSAALRDLRTKDFGSLSEDIDNLYKRLNLRLDPSRAWRFFAADTQSFLIQKFSEMYVLGKRMGGEPRRLGEVISANMHEVVQLRERRDQATLTFAWELYSFTALSTIALFAALSIVQAASGAAISLDLGSAGAVNLAGRTTYDPKLLETLVIGVLLANAGLSSLLIRALDGGHKVKSYLHLVLLAWLMAIVAVLTKAVVAVGITTA